MLLKPVGTLREAHSLLFQSGLHGGLAIYHLEPQSQCPTYYNMDELVAGMALLH